MDDHDEPCPPGHCEPPGPLSPEAKTRVLAYFDQLVAEQRWIDKYGEPPPGLSS